MDLPNLAVISTLTYLLPGFIAAAVIYSLTPNPRPTPFERIIQALILTMVVQALVVILWAGLLFVGRWYSIGRWSDNSQLVAAVAIGLTLGVAWARLLNNDKIHGALRRLGVTQQTSYSSEWYGALCQNSQYVVLHLKGERRLYGWPEEWPSTPDHGHFVLAQPEWLDDSESRGPNGVAKILIAARDVEMVELMAPLEVPRMETPDGRPQGAHPTPTITSGKDRRGQDGHSELATAESPHAPAAPAPSAG